MESRTVIDTPNCIWKPKELIECSKSLACNEIIKSGRISDMTPEKKKVICKKHNVKYKSIVVLLSLKETKTGFLINK